MNFLKRFLTIFFCSIMALIAVMSVVLGSMWLGGQAGDLMYSHGSSVAQAAMTAGITTIGLMVAVIAAFVVALD